MRRCKLHCDRLGGLLLGCLAITPLEADEPAWPHPVHHPESPLHVGWRLAAGGSGAECARYNFPNFHESLASTWWSITQSLRWGVNQHNYLAYGGKFWLMWSDGPGVEDRVGQRVKFATSEDGLTWTEPRFLTPEPPHSGPASAHYGKRSDQGGVRYISRGFWQRHSELYALASLDEAAGFFGPSLELHAFRVQLSNQTWEVMGVIADDSINNFPPKQLASGQWMMSRRSHDYKTTGVQFLIGGDHAIDQWESFPSFLEQPVN